MSNCPDLSITDSRISVKDRPVPVPEGRAPPGMSGRSNFTPGTKEPKNKAKNANILPHGLKKEYHFEHFSPDYEGIKELQG